jgi:hypothetical protein
MRVVYDPRSGYWNVVDTTGGVIARHLHYSDAIADLRHMRGIS